MLFRLINIITYSVLLTSHCLVIAFMSVHGSIKSNQINSIVSNIIYIILNYIKVTHVCLDVSKMFMTLVWNDQQTFYLHHFDNIILPVLFRVCQISIHCFIIELQYNQPYDITLLTTHLLHIIYGQPF